MKNDTLTRYAAVVPVLVEAGCEGLPIAVELSREGILRLDEDIRLPDDQYNGLIIAVLEQWFHQTVVPWAWLKHGISVYWQAGGGITNGIKSPCEPKWWLETWNDEHIAEGSILTCLEALAEVIGASNE